METICKSISLNSKNIFVILEIYYTTFKHFYLTITVLLTFEKTMKLKLMDNDNCL